jgi:hypothetical protein
LRKLIWTGLKFSRPSGTQLDYIRDVMGDALPLARSKQRFHRVRRALDITLDKFLPPESEVQ